MVAYLSLELCTKLRFYPDMSYNTFSRSNIALTGTDALKSEQSFYLVCDKVSGNPRRESSHRKQLYLTPSLNAGFIYMMF